MNIFFRKGFYHGLGHAAILEKGWREDDSHSPLCQLRAARPKIRFLDSDWMTSANVANKLHLKIHWSFLAERLKWGKGCKGKGKCEQNEPVRFQNWIFPHPDSDVWLSGSENGWPHPSLKSCQIYIFPKWMGTQNVQIKTLRSLKALTFWAFFPPGSDGWVSGVF